METEQLNIEGKRSGSGFIAHRERLVQALSRAQAPKVEVIDTTLGRKGLLNYIRLLGGSNIIKVIPSNGDASGVRVADKGLKVVCGSNTGYLEDGAWVTEKIKVADTCQIRVSPNSSIKPNLGGMELAEALSRVIPFAAKGDDRPVLACVRFAQKDGKLTLTSADGFRLAEVSLDFEDGEGEALIPAIELRGLTSALRKAKRVRLGFEDRGERACPSKEGLDSKHLVIDTELIRYKWSSLSGNYPDYEKVIPTEFVAEARFDARDMLRASASLSALYLDKDTAIIIAIKGGMMRLSVKDEKGEAQIEAEAQGEAMTAVNGAYLRQALKALAGMVELKVKDPQSPMLFSVDGYRLVVMPVNIGIGAVAKPEAVAPVEAVAQAEAVAEQAEAVAEGKAEIEDKPKRKRKKEPVAVA
jgi:DNA polymerase-3 subunit beta